MTKTVDQTFLKVKDHLVSGESFELVYDSERKFLKTVPQPDMKVIHKYYESADYISHTDSKAGFMAKIYQWVKKYSLSKKLRLVNALNRGPGKLLDIGAGTGDFLVLSKKHQWDVQGVEPNFYAGNLSATKGVALVKNIDELEGQLFDVVTLWHVLEHLPNLDNTLLKIEALVRPGGNLIIAAPNYNSFDATYYKEYWAAYDTPRHLWHFSRESMSVLFSRGMTLFKVKPLIFDSFYVSLLSEKYKSRSKFSMKAIFIGLWSNISAWRTKEFSSLVYCFKKAV